MAHTVTGSKAQTCRGVCRPGSRRTGRGPARRPELVWKSSPRDSRPHTAQRRTLAKGTNVPRELQRPEPWDTRAPSGCRSLQRLWGETEHWYLNRQKMSLNRLRLRKRKPRPPPPDPKDVRGASEGTTHRADGRNTPPASPANTREETRPRLVAVRLAAASQTGDTACWVLSRCHRAVCHSGPREPDCHYSPK